MTDEADNRFRFDKEFAPNPGETYTLRVDDSSITDPDSVLVLPPGMERSTKFVG